MGGGPFVVGPTLRWALGSGPTAETRLSLFGPEHPLPRLAGQAEHWAGSEAFGFAHVWLGETGDIREAARRAYAEAYETLRAQGYGYWLRTWTYFDRINEGEGVHERYRQFCIGRAEALPELEGYPAATVIGCDRPGLWLWVIAGRAPGEPVENPRQVPAWAYPPQYGPQSPGFTRAMWLAAPGLLLVSGTSSVVGHATVHPHDAEAQLRETWRNLGTLVERAQQQTGARLQARSLRLYLRSPVLAAELLEACRRWQPQAAWSAHIGAICRRDLEVEIEGLWQRA